MKELIDINKYKIPCSYIIYIDDYGNVCARNGKDGNIDFINTDASAVIQNAINTFNKSIGGDIYIRKGVYNLTSGLVIAMNDTGTRTYPGFLIRGEGPGTILKNQSISPAITVNSNFTALNNFRVQGQIGSGDGILLENATGFAHHDVFHNNINNLMLDTNNNGLIISGRCYENNIQNIFCLQNRTNGILLQTAESYTPNNQVFINITTMQNGNDGLNISSGNTNNFYNIYTSLNSRYGIYVNSTNNTFFGIYSESNFAKGVFTDAGIYDNVFISHSIFDGYTFTAPQNTLLDGRLLRIPGIDASIITTDYLILDWAIQTGQIATAQSRNFQSWDGSVYQDVIRMQAGYADILRGRYINMTTTQTTLNGTTSGSIIWSMPFQGSSYKRFIAFLSGYRNNTSIAQQIKFPIAFNKIPKLVVDDSNVSSVSTTILTLPISMNSAITGWIIVEGY